MSRDDRQRDIGGGRKYKLKSFNDKLLLVLMFYKLYFTFEVLGFLFFDLDKSSVSLLISRLEPVLSKRLRSGKIVINRDRSKPISSVKEMLRVYPEIEAFIGDATEQELEKPKNKLTRKKYYSGKKKRHTVKTQIVLNRATGEICDVSGPFAGSVHDYDIFKQTRPPDKIPEGSTLYLDKGYDGAKKHFPDCNIVIPKKANRWHKLSRKDKLNNQEIGRNRIPVEHSILKCKRFNVLHHIYRHSLENYGRRFQIIAALVNFKINFAVAQLEKQPLNRIELDLAKAAIV